MTANGLITSSDGQAISSSLDWEAFQEEATYYNNFIVGRRTLEATQTALIEVGCGFKIIVSTDETLKLPPGFLLASSPQAALDLLEGNAEEAYLVGGAELNSSFAAQGLIDELAITIEPHIVGAGLNLFSPKIPRLNLDLIDTQTLLAGRIKLRYQVQNNAHPHLN